MNEVIVSSLPDCDLCKIEGVTKPAHYDTKTILGGQWGNLCESHMKTHGVTPTNRLLVQSKRQPKRTFDKIPTATFKLTRAIVYDEKLPKVKCPWCNATRTVEMDANYTVTCESCGKPYRVVSPI